MLLLLLCLSALRSVSGADAADPDGDDQYSNMKKLKDKLFAGYDKTVRPGAHHNDTVQTMLAVLPMYLVDLDEEKSLFSMDSLFLNDWEDERLKWNESDHEGVTVLHVPDDLVWHPDIKILNGHSGNVDPGKNVPVVIFSTGWVIWDPSVAVATFCDVSTPVGNYPYDVHKCNISIGSWTHEGKQVDMKPGPGALNWERFTNTNPRWEVVMEESSMQRVVKKYNCCKEPYIRLDVTFVLKRRPPPHLQIVWLPCVFMMVLSLGMFWIPSHSTKKIIFGVGLLIVLAILTVYCALMTKSPQAQLLAVSFVRSTMIAVSVAVFIEIIVVNVAGIGKSVKPPDILVRLLSGTVGNYICVWSSGRSRIPGDKIRLQDEADRNDQTDLQWTTREEWLLVATGIDRVLFIIFIVVFAAIHQV